MTNDEVTIDIQMEEVEATEEVTGKLKFHVSDTSGSILTDATISVNADGYDKQKHPNRMGMAQTFTDVPMPADVEVTCDGYKDVTMTVTEGDLGGDDITHGY